MLHQFEIFLKQGAPARAIDDEGLIERWKEAREKGDIYLDTQCGTILVDSILSINDMHLVARAGTQYNLENETQVRDTKKGIFLPQGHIGEYNKKKA